MRLPRTLLTMLPVALLSACGGPFIDNPNASRDEHGRNPSSSFTLDKASIRTGDDRSFDIRRIVVSDPVASGPAARLVSRADAGITAVDQNRLALDGIPLAGQLFMPRLREADFAEGRRIGTVFAAGDTLFVTVEVMQRNVTWRRIVLANQSFAWVFPPPSPVEAAAPAAGGGPARAVGAAYVRGDGETLLLLVRPSIITDSLF